MLILLLIIILTAIIFGSLRGGKNFGDIIKKGCSSMLVIAFLFLIIIAIAIFIILQEFS